ncbi:MAG: tRNA pseudouridine(55) synthase TruB [Deltaproteobacteria bacterium CG_4_8_14_3_um_filter_51_11]|nr:tRNA pseudouridine(55) synthase TruB [bacterium]OIP43882.1 MAG: tRNA pseudouridine(55) synthase TruB [Desulfobacteraceae bacterium CG2_30_51_40]PIP45204.1 MAG: tRNA pseudouridine(55) synthase TruB [Deltaproteobacteria bacterium CG23_combo_of_CG06-09_8_20_14_all_51_20]PIV98642.1 MAG: tRNA pseudouridine(55) synthase TruB [Deltaproteobacteria bacterium CG17_big_fil_post_rev_8_21_14_2_50_51_6]PIX19324.1 MAG: tRNA pseudouridine(55) synthase TruB [Deltaproteobacteria bacterium CG_4_8_14_3_um_filte
MNDTTDGILLIDKDTVDLSSEVVRRVKRILGARKVGHAGTLDPFASGLLIILMGRATALTRFIQAWSKNYRGLILLGSETDTMDPTGRVIRTLPVPRLERSVIERAAGSFVGEIWQTPPAFSAVRIQGKRAYSLARKGVMPDLSPRKVTIHSLDIVYCEGPVIDMEVSCSSGTYIRRLAYDLAVSLGTIGHLITLRRTVCGPFRAYGSIRSSDLKGPLVRDELRERIMPIADALPDMPAIEIDAALARSLRVGRKPSIEELTRQSEKGHPAEGFLRLLNRGDLTAIVRIGSAEDIKSVSLERVFPSPDNIN